MCNIAGYTGNKRAAPILIEMLRKEQFIDGGVCTGIATIHEGKLYHAKVVGTVEDLLAQTDALNFPGTCGIAHSRPGGTLVSQAHPFLDKDEKFALILNGTLFGVQTEAFFQHSRDIMQSFLDRGFPIRSAIPENGMHLPLSNGMAYHGSESYALMVGDYVDQGDAITTAFAKALSELPADIVAMGVHAQIPDTITAGKISRPLNIGLADGETYLATTALAFPEDTEYRSIFSVPTTTIVQATPGALRFSEEKIENVKVEDVDPGMYAKAYVKLEEALLHQKDNPKSVYELPEYKRYVNTLWRRPPVECKYVVPGDYLKPHAALLYDLLWTFHLEGRLRSCIGEHAGRVRTKFWLE